MAELTFHNGNLITDSSVDVICHQVNCQAVMGRGIAKEIHQRFPRVFSEYVKLCKEYRLRGRSPLGACQLVWTDDDHNRLVANLFGQEYYGTKRQQTDYAQLQQALTKLANNRFLREHHMSLGFPDHIGCALGGGDWNIVLPMIRKTFSEYPFPVEIWKL